MVNIRTERTRDEFEEDWKDQGFEMIFEDRDDQIWIRQPDQEELLFVSWVACAVQAYKLDKFESIAGIIAAEPNKVIQVKLT